MLVGHNGTNLITCIPSLLSTLFSFAMAYAGASYYHNAWQTYYIPDILWLLPVFICFFSSMLFFALFEGCIATLIVLFSEDPDRFAVNYPEYQDRIEKILEVSPDKEENV